MILHTTNFGVHALKLDKKYNNDSQGCDRHTPLIHTDNENYYAFYGKTLPPIYGTTYTTVRQRCITNSGKD